MGVCGHTHTPLEVSFEAANCDFIQFYMSHLVLMEALITGRRK